MNRYDEIENIIYTQLEKNCYGLRKKEAYRHLFGVSTLCLQLSFQFHLDPELCAIMGLMHDLSAYVKNSRLSHAFVSSQLAKDILSATELFTEEEMTVITTAIFNHSAKDRIDDPYSELLKLCDVIESYLHEPDVILNQQRQRYLKIAKEKKIISIPLK